MKNEYTPDVIDFAYQIISMNEEIARLRGEVKHYKKMYEMLRDSQNDSIKHTKKTMGMLLTAAIDPNSAISKGHEAIMKEKKK